MKFTSLFSIATIAFLGLTGVQAKCDKNLVTTSELCLKNLAIPLKNCGSDEVCKCKAQYDIIRCYDYCPDDEEYQGKLKLHLSTVTIQCGSAGVSTSTIIKAQPTSSSDTPKPSGADKNTTGGKPSGQASNSIGNFNSMQLASTIFISASVAYALL